MRSKLGRGLWAVGLAGVLAVLSTAAQAGEVRANVPFGFTVGKRTLPAGSYTLSSNATSVLVRGFKDGAVASTDAAEEPRGVSPRLVFRRYGDLYVLREVWMGGGTGRLLPASPAEREIAGREARFDRVEIPLM